MDVMYNFSKANDVKPHPNDVTFTKIFLTI